MAKHHPRIEDAASGILPEWSKVSRSRHGHMERVSDLMGEWAAEMGLRKRERRRWRAVGLLHDALKGARGRDMKRWVRRRIRDLPVPVLHGPAAAARLRTEGVDDFPFLNAIAYHTLGHSCLDELGRALYAADFLEPGRRVQPKMRAALRERMPQDLDDVVREIVGARLRYMIKKDRVVRPETVGFWNTLNGGEEWDLVSVEF